MKEYIAKRSKKIGKPMMGCLHIHKSAIDTLPEDLKEIFNEKVQYIGNFQYDIVKIDPKNMEVAFTQSKDWDICDEPQVGTRKTVKFDNSVKDTKESTFIYHHKWMFVKDDYSGFNVEESKKRSEYWMNHPHVLGLKNDKNEKFNSKIGRKEYWDNNVCAFIDKQ